MRLVVDTNVVLDLVVFDDPGARSLRAAIEAGRVEALANEATLAELRRVLGYPEFKLDQAKQDEAFEWYRSRVEVVTAAAAEPRLPRCNDPDDQKFLDLAWQGGAAHLVTKDRELLTLATRVAKLGRFLVSSPTDRPWPIG